MLIVLQDMVLDGVEIIINSSGSYCVFYYYFVLDIKS